MYICNVTNKTLLRMKTIKEIWKPVEGYEGIYEVSNFGRVKSLNYHREGIVKILKPQKDGSGYLQVQLWRNGKMKAFKVHRLVAEAFLPNPLGLPEINHKDEDKTNNIVSNLEWASRWDNMHYGTLYERTSKSVEASRFSDFRTIELRFASTKEAGRNGYSSGNVSACCRGCYCSEENNKYKGLYWRFAV